MSERKPPGVSFESWVDKQIREATERGDFADLPGAGKPLPHLDQPYDEMWWIKEKMQREHLSYLPPSLVLRKDAEEAREAAANAPTEAALRRILTAVNERIRAALRTPLEGPPLNLVPFDIDEQARKWRERHGS
ncbi:DnaJ family domain-containing protein [Streptomyces sp. NPDC001739]|uniref:DnaJ family domain-containing protein n=1 Tax=Streptomyces sp. NPDC001657 TaxID=3154522 RepID=UPI00331B59BB